MAQLRGGSGSRWWSVLSFGAELAQNAAMLVLLDACRVAGVGSRGRVPCGARWQSGSRLVGEPVRSALVLARIRLAPVGGLNMRSASMRMMMKVQLPTESGNDA